MARQIKNRREDLYINDVPPEILTETELSADGFVKNTDYAGSTGGVIRVGVTYATAMTTGATPGYLTAMNRTAEQYASMGNNAFISKGTLENVILSVVKAKIQSDMGELYESAEVGDTWTVILRKTADGLVFDYAPTA